MNYCLVYLSKAPQLDEQQLNAILQQSRANNATTGITGVLLYVRGSIIQVLEGEKQAVEALFDKIQTDSRHTDVSRVIGRPVEQRQFAQWAMGYETLTSSQLDELEDWINQTASASDTVAGPALLRTLQVFYDSNRYN